MANEAETEILDVTNDDWNTEPVINSGEDRSSSAISSQQPGAGDAIPSTLDEAPSRSAECDGCVAASSHRPAIKFDEAQTISAKYIRKQNIKIFQAKKKEEEKKPSVINKVAETSKKSFMQLTRTILQLIHYTWLEILFLGLAFKLIQYLNTLEPLQLDKRTFRLVHNCHNGKLEGLLQYSWPPLNTGNHTCEIAYMIPPAVVYKCIIISAATTFLGIQIWVRDLWDFVAATLGLMEALAVSEISIRVLKISMGKMRPTFMSACNFSVPHLVNTDQPMPLIGNHHPRDTTLGIVALNCNSCRKVIADAFESFPAARTVRATVTGIYLSLYLNAKLKAFSNYHTAMWKTLTICLPVLASTLVTTMNYTEHSHFTEDLIYSITLADLIALVLYRAHYASVFDYKTNHQPLPFSSSHRINNAEVEAEKTDEGASELRKFAYRFAWRKKKKQLVAVQWPRPRQSRHSQVEDGDAIRDDKTKAGGKLGSDEKTSQSEKDLIHPITPPHGSAGMTMAGALMRGLVGVPAMGASSDGVLETGGQQPADRDPGPSALANEVGMDGAEGRSDVPLAIRRMAIHDLSTPPRSGLKYRLSRGRYSLARDRRRQRSSGQSRSSDEETSVTVRPYRLRTVQAIRMMSRATRKGVRASKRSAGAMV